MKNKFDNIKQVFQDRDTYIQQKLYRDVEQNINGFYIYVATNSYCVDIVSPQGVNCWGFVFLRMFPENHSSYNDRTYNYRMYYNLHGSSTLEDYRKRVKIARSYVVRAKSREINGKYSKV